MHIAFRLALSSMMLMAFSALSGSSRAQAQQQVFTSGSDGSDGALELTTPGTILFDPANTALFGGRAIDVDGDNVYHFTTIFIGPGVSVRMSGDILSGPQIWLAQGEVVIEGALDLRGTNGSNSTDLPLTRMRSVAGAGGFPGGLGGSSTRPTEAGRGPAGGAAGRTGGGGSLFGNAYLVPLYGGSGGGGGDLANTGLQGGGGGGGAGSILIASSIAVTVSGSILASGGAGGNGANFGGANGTSFGGGGGGSGGAIHLLAPTLAGAGQLSAVAGVGGGFGGQGGGTGRIRLEAFQQSFNGSAQPAPTRSAPYAVFLPTGRPPRIRVTRVDGIAIPVRPTASLTAPDVEIPDGSSVPIEVEARDVPPGTVVDVHIFSENGSDQTVAATLAGTRDLSTATALVEVPPGFSRSYVRVTFAQP